MDMEGKRVEAERKGIIPEHVVCVGYIEDGVHQSRFIEGSDEVCGLFEQWAASQDIRLTWRKIHPFGGLVMQLQEWRDLMQRLQDVLQVTVSEGDVRLLVVLRQAVERLEGLHVPQEG